MVGKRVKVINRDSAFYGMVGEVVGEYKWDDRVSCEVSLDMIGGEFPEFENTELQVLYQRPALYLIKGP